MVPASGLVAAAGAFRARLLAHLSPARRLPHIHQPCARMLTLLLPAAHLQLPRSKEHFEAAEFQRQGVLVRYCCNCQ